MAQQTLYEAEAEVETRNWEKRNSDIAFHEISQEFEHFSYIKQVCPPTRQIRLRERQNQLVWRIGVEK